MSTAPRHSAGSNEPSRQRQIAEGFGADAEAYDRARPSYPQEMADAVVGEFAGTFVVDVGIGTGISSKPFVRAGCTVLGVEPDARMAGIARRRGFDVEIGTFEDWNPAGRQFDGLIAGQTWHWVDPTAGAAKAAEVLRPDGQIALFWNVMQPAPEVSTAFNAVYQRVNTGLPFEPWSIDPLAAQSPILDKTVEGIRRTGAFGDLMQRRFDWRRECSRDEWLDVVPTSGGHSRMPRARLDELLTGIGNAVDEAGGSFTMGYATLLVTAARNPDRRN